MKQHESQSTPDLCKDYNFCVVVYLYCRQRVQIMFHKINIKHDFGRIKQTKNKSHNSKCNWKIMRKLRIRNHCLLSVTDRDWTQTVMGVSALLCWNNWLFTSFMFHIYDILTFLEKRLVIFFILNSFIIYLLLLFRYRPFFTTL